MTGRPYEAVFFDFGGTLAPLSPVPRTQRIRRTYTERGFAAQFELTLPDDAQLDAIAEACSQRAGWPVRPGWQTHYQQYYGRWAEYLLAELGVTEAVAAKYADAFGEAFRDLSDAVRVLYNDCRHTLDALTQAGLRLAIVSNNDGTLARRVEYLGIDHYFEIVIDSAVVESNKPDSVIFRHAFDAMRLKATQVLYVGDTFIADVVGPAAVGMASAWLNRTHCPVPPSPPMPALVIQELAELPPLLFDGGKSIRA